MKLMKLTHFITTVLTEEDIEILFQGLGGLNEFKITDYWKNTQTLAQVISQRAADRYSDRLNIIGDLGEILIEAMIAQFPTAFHIKPYSVVLPDLGQKGYDIQAEHANDGKAMWLQIKFYCPWESFGEKDTSETIHKLDSFVQSTVQDSQVYHKRHRLLITTARNIHYRIGELGYSSQMTFYTLADLENIISQGQKRPSVFWYEFKESLLASMKEVIPLPTPVTPYKEQSKDADEIVAKLESGNCTYIAPVGTGKTIVALEAIKRFNENNNN